MPNGTSRTTARTDERTNGRRVDRVTGQVTGIVLPDRFSAVQVPVQQEDVELSKNEAYRAVASAAGPVAAPAGAPGSAEAVSVPTATTPNAALRVPNAECVPSRGAARHLPGGTRPGTPAAPRS
ncbi:hypothetical protein ACFXGI_14980 [Streptomyces sp. NPDC059355]|uniref:hypothetical protein n=1 Tax=Streptomyces sp. NPDC059355 TaxID=3346811 RepID=UPI00369A1C77